MKLTVTVNQTTSAPDLARILRGLAKGLENEGIPDTPHVKIDLFGSEEQFLGTAEWFSQDLQKEFRMQAIFTTEIPGTEWLGLKSGPQIKASISTGESVTVEGSDLFSHINAVLTLFVEYPKIEWGDLESWRCGEMDGGFVWVRGNDW